MKLVYTNANRLLVNNAHNILESEGIEIVLKNEFSGGAAGDLSPFDTWLELWVKDDRDFEQAHELLEQRFSESQQPDWVCSHCNETNDASFDFCWNCETLREFEAD